MNEADKKAFDEWAQLTGNLGDGAREAWQAALAHRDKKAGEAVARVIDDGTPEGAVEWIPVAKGAGPLSAGDLLYTTPPAVAVNEQTLEALSDMYEAIDSAFDLTPSIMYSAQAAIAAAKAAKGE